MRRDEPIAVAIRAISVLFQHLHYDTLLGLPQAAQAFDLLLQLRDGRSMTAPSPTWRAIACGVSPHYPERHLQQQRQSVQADHGIITTKDQ
jgi:hypothetical protein